MYPDLRYAENWKVPTWKRRLSWTCVNGKPFSLHRYSTRFVAERHSMICSVTG